MHSSQITGMGCALYVVATPIGNMRDITLRALDILREVPVIAAEDTRNTAHLLEAHNLMGKRLLALHQHNERSAAEKLINLLSEGQSVALVTDAGTPAVSDPGALVVQAVREAGYRVVPIPGASAVVTALCASGFDNPHFLFYGFLPNKTTARCKVLQELQDQPATLVFYEAPHRIEECVADLLAVLGGEREIVLARELTKLFESIHRCALSDAPAWLQSDPNNLRGEFVVLVSGAPQRQQGISAEAQHVLDVLLKELPLKQAVQLAVQITGMPRNELYQQALASKQEQE